VKIKIHQLIMHFVIYVRDGTGDDSPSFNLVSVFRAGCKLAVFSCNQVHLRVYVR